MTKKFSDNELTALTNHFLQIANNGLGQLIRCTEEMSSGKRDDDYYQLVEKFCHVTRDIAAAAHQGKMIADWQIPPNPEWFDHFIDQYFDIRNDNTLWMERGVYSVAALKQGGDFLELCCGDGFNARHFYAKFAKSIIAFDFDPAAIAHAKSYNAAKNVRFVCGDVRTDLPDGRFSNIIWDAAIEHFTESEIAAIMRGIKERLDHDGILSGYTIVEKEDGEKHLHQHEREFRSKDDLMSFIKPYFKNAIVFETIHPNRHNLYFYASDGPVPFSDEWQGAIRHQG